MGDTDGNLRILAIDIGVGTQDILVYDEGKIPENNIKIVLPSMTQVLAKKVYHTKGDILFYGETMGGGPIANAILRHIKKGYKVYMTPNSARTIRDNLKEVEEMGVKIIDEEDTGNYDCERIQTRDVDFNLIKNILVGVGEDFKFDFIGLAVQDHGYAPKKSDRAFRFEKIKETVERNPKVTGFLYRDPPPYFSRMRSIVKFAKNFCSGDIVVVDSKIAAVVGATYGLKERPIVAVDIGNGHTLVSMIGEDDRFLGILEHHTGMLDRNKLEKYIIRFANGEVSNEEIFNDEGHGCYIREKVGSRNIKKFLITGPRRRLLEGSKIKIEFASPMGDVMMTGVAGIISLIKASR